MPLRFLWVSEGGRGSAISRRRLDNLRAQEVRLAGAAHLVVIPQLFGEVSGVVAIKKLLLRKLDLAQRLVRDPEALVLIGQDDVQLCGRFLEELEALLREAPQGWRTLHLCAGYMWGRSSNRRALDSSLPDLVPEDPEWRVPARGRRGRRFINLFAPAWPGGPLALLVRREGVSTLLEDLARTKEDTPDDVSLYEIATEHDYLVRGSLLCHEREQGGSQHAAHLQPPLLVGVAALFVAVFAPPPRAKLAAIVTAVVAGLVLVAQHALRRAPPASEAPELVRPPLAAARCPSAIWLPPAERVLPWEQWLARLQEAAEIGGWVPPPPLGTSSEAFDFAILEPRPERGERACWWLPEDVLSVGAPCSFLPCAFAPGHAAARAVATAVKTARECGVEDEDYLASLPDAVLCEWLSGTREKNWSQEASLREACTSAALSLEDTRFFALRRRVRARPKALPPTTKRR